MNIRCACKRAYGSVEILPSKSFAHRLLISAGLSDTPCEIVCPAKSEDIAATVRCLGSLGAKIEEKSGVYTVNPISLRENAELFCGESGSTLRFLIPIAATFPGKVKFTGAGRLPSRPLGALVKALSENGAKISYDGTLPLETSGGLRSGIFKVPGDISSQFISGLIFALPVLSGESRIQISGKCESREYIEMTVSAVSDFGIDVDFSDNEIKIPGGQKYVSPKKLTVEGDWSNGAFWACLGALSDDGITVMGLLAKSIQGDRAIVDVLRRFGAEVLCGDDFITVKKGKLCGIEIDASGIPDLVPALSVVAAVAEGETKVYNASRLRLKESDRIKTTVDMLTALGGRAQADEDSIKITGQEELLGGVVNAYNDHRIVMASAIAAKASRKEVIIEGAEAVNKSYGDFFEKYKMLGAEVDEI